MDLTISKELIKKCSECYRSNKRRVSALKGVITKQKGYLENDKIRMEILRRQISGLKRRSAGRIGRLRRRSTYRKCLPVLLETLNAGEAYLRDGNLFIVGYDCDGDFEVRTGTVWEQTSVDTTYVVPLTKKGFSVEILKG